MKNALHRLRRRSGQSAIEFIVVVVVILFFLLFFLSLSILLVTSDYVEYATFMSARTYKSMFGSQNDQRVNAKTVFDTYVSRIQGVGRNFKLSYVGGGQRGEQAAGVRATYDIDLFYLPPLFMTTNIPKSSITLSTETRLGRDSSYEECFNFFDKFVQKFPIGIGGSKYVGLMDDNGC